MLQLAAYGYALSWLRVLDESNLFVKPPVGYMTTIMGTSQRSVVIPCPVTDPDLRVTLLRGYGYNKQKIIEVPAPRLLGMTDWLSSR